MVQPGFNICNTFAAGFYYSSRIWPVIVKMGIHKQLTDTHCLFAFITTKLMVDLISLGSPWKSLRHPFMEHGEALVDQNRRSGSELPNMKRIVYSTI